MNDVAVIGVGLHPFGRFEGKSAMQMGAEAIKLALDDAGLEWNDVQFAVGGSWTVERTTRTERAQNAGRSGVSPYKHARSRHRAPGSQDVFLSGGE